MPSFAPRRFVLAVLRPILVWVLALALPVNGVSTLTNLLLGASHRHVSVAPGNSGLGTASLPQQWHELLRTVLGNEAMSLIDAHHGRLAQTSLQAAQAAQHAHLHDTFQRHLHDPMDGSVVALGDKGSSQEASGTQTADTSSPQWMPPDAAVQWLSSWVLTVWPDAQERGHAGHVPLLLERPPKA